MDKVCWIPNVLYDRIIAELKSPQARLQTLTMAQAAPTVNHPLDIYLNGTPKECVLSPHETYGKPRSLHSPTVSDFSNPIKVHASIRSISSSSSCVSRLVSSVISRLSLYSNVPSSMASSFLARRRESMATISFALQTNICCSGNKSKTSWYQNVRE